MGSEGFNRHLEMVNAGCFSPKGPLTTKFLLVFGEQSNACPRFYGKVKDKKKVYDHALKDNIHPEVHAKWGHLKCHCSLIPKMRLSKTARNLNKVFLTCGASATSESRCKYFPWIHTPLFIDRRPIQQLKFASKQTQTEWLQQAEQNVEQWQRDQAWLNQFTETIQKQNEQWEAKKKTKPSNPWKKTLPSTFHWSPQIAEETKKQDPWKEIHSIANGEFEASINRTMQKWGKVPASDVSLASFLQKQKTKGKPISPADEKFLEACQPNKPKHGEWKPPSEAEQFEKNEAVMAKFVHPPWPFGALPEKVCSLASYCRKRKQQGLPLTPAQERFFAQLVNVHDKEPVPKCHEQFLEGLKQGAIIRCVNF